MILLTKYLLSRSEGFSPVISVFLPEVLFDVFMRNHSEIGPLPLLEETTEGGVVDRGRGSL